MAAAILLAVAAVRVLTQALHPDPDSDHGPHAGLVSDQHTMSLNIRPILSSRACRNGYRHPGPSNGICYAPLSLGTSSLFIVFTLTITVGRHPLALSSLFPIDLA